VFALFGQKFANERAAALYPDMIAAHGQNNSFGDIGGADIVDA
jgi:hypothetical protein